MNRKSFLYSFLILMLVSGMFTGVYAQTTTSTDLSKLSAQGVAIYGWKNGKATLLYGKKGNTLFPIASLTKLVTAKAVETLYPASSVFTMTASAFIDTKEANLSVVTGTTLNRDDMLRALLVNSTNAVANQFAISAGGTTLVDTMNNFLHANHYTTTKFVNPSGLDPDSKAISPNRMTPNNLSSLMSDIFTKDPLVTSILETKGVLLTDQSTGRQIQIKSSNELNADPAYNYFIILSKTGSTDLAQQDLAFVTNGGTTYDYVTVVFMHSKNRYSDGQIILNWLQKVLSNPTKA